MFKLCPTLVALLALSVLTLAELQLLVPDDNLTLLTGRGKSVQTRLSLASAPSAEPAVVASSEESQSDDNDDDDSSASNDDAPAPALVTRLTQSSAGRASGSPGLLLTTSSNAAGGLSSLQHHILPAEAIPLPITFAARTGLRTIIAPETITIHQPTVAKIGEVVQKVPTAVSHQSQTVVHNHARVVTPIVAPAVRSITSQLLRTIHQPVLLAEHGRVLRVVNN